MGCLLILIMSITHSLTTIEFLDIGAAYHNSSGLVAGWVAQWWGLFLNATQELVGKSNGVILFIVPKTPSNQTTIRVRDVKEKFTIYNTQRGQLLL